MSTPDKGTALKVYENDVTDWVVAFSPEDADAVLREAGHPTPDDPHEWTECDIDRTWALVEPAELAAEHTFRDWIAINGRGFLGSTEY